LTQHSQQILNLHPFTKSFEAAFMRDAVLSFALTIAMCSETVIGLSAVHSRRCTSQSLCFMRPLPGSVTTCTGITCYTSRSKHHFIDQCAHIFNVFFYYLLTNAYPKNDTFLSTHIRLPDVCEATMWPPLEMHHTSFIETNQFRRLCTQSIIKN
jgi:hypothetical protein